MTRPGVEVWAELLARLRGTPALNSAAITAAEVFDRVAAAVPAFAGLDSESLPATGAALDVPPAGPGTAPPAGHDGANGADSMAQVQG